MKISHTELEVCIQHPRRWLQQKAAAQSHGYLMGYNRATLLSIYHFHKSQSAASARDHLQSLIDRHGFKDPLRVEGIELSLESYMSWVEANQVAVADTRVRLAVDSGFLTLVGEISRVDVTNAGYRAVLLGVGTPMWRQELRMPLIQSAIAMRYGRPVAEVAVGVQTLDSSGLQTHSYGATALSRAARRFSILSRRLRRAAGGRIT